MKTVSITLLCLVMAISMLTGCAANESDIVGKWEAEIDISRFIAGIYGAPENSTSTPVKVTLTFTAYGTCTGTLDETGLREAVRAILTANGGNPTDDDVENAAIAIGTGEELTLSSFWETKEDKLYIVLLGDESGIDYKVEGDTLTLQVKDDTFVFTKVG